MKKKVTGEGENPFFAESRKRGKSKSKGFMNQAPKKEGLGCGLERWNNSFCVKKRRPKEKEKKQKSHKNPSGGKQTPKEKGGIQRGSEERTHPPKNER